MANLSTKIASALAAMTLLGTACEGRVGMGPQDPMVEEDKHDPGPIQDRMPTAEDCSTEEAVFTNDGPARLLTRYEYDNSIRDLFGLDLGLARENFPSENSMGGFENSVDSHRVSPLLVRKYVEIADDIAAQAVAENSYGDGFIPDLAFRAFRRPPSTEELKAFETLYTTATEAWGRERAQEMVVSAILQSPQFLYRLEFADGRVPNEIVQNDGYEMASRLSYLIWASIPDETLLEAAARDELKTREQVETQVRRMLDDPRAREMIAHYYRQWLHLDALEDVVKDGELFPNAPSTIPQDWRASIDAWIRHVHFESSGKLPELFRSNEVFVTPDMATVYDVPVGDSMDMVSMNETRAGLLTQPAFLALHAYPEQGSPIHRGIFVREKLLCQKLAPPPDDVPIEPPDPDPNATTRERFRQHTEDPSCANCHKFIDPIGFGFEEYDAVGAHRSMEAGVAIDASGEVIGSGDEELDGPFDGVLELSERLEKSTVVSDCIADQWTTFAMGQPPTRADLCSQREIRAKFAESKSFEDLLTAIATSDAMRFRVVQGDSE